MLSYRLFCAGLLIISTVSACATSNSTKEKEVGPVLTIEGNRARGRGFLVSPNGCFLLTAHEHHAMRDSLAVYPNFGASSLRRLGFIGNPTDLALFKLEGVANVPHLRLTKSFYWPDAGERVWILMEGQTKRTEAKFTDHVMGFFSLKLADGTKLNYFGYTLHGQIKRGDSGLPILNAKGEAIAVVFAAGKDIFFGAPVFSDLIMKMLPGNTECETPP